RRSRSSSRSAISRGARGSQSRSCAAGRCCSESSWGAGRSTTLWPDGALRVGLGCMRLESDAPIRAAAEAGVTVFDTARAYDGSEQLLAQALRGSDARIVTKGGMARPDGVWTP